MRISRGMSEKTDVCAQIHLIVGVSTKRIQNAKRRGVQQSEATRETFGKAEETRGIVWFLAHSHSSRQENPNWILPRLTVNRWNLKVKIGEIYFIPNTIKRYSCESRKWKSNESIFKIRKWKRYKYTSRFSRATRRENISIEISLRFSGFSLFVGNGNEGRGHESEEYLKWKRTRIRRIGPIRSCGHRVCHRRVSTDTPGQQHDAVVDIIIYITDIQLVLELHSSIPFAVAILLRYIDPRPRLEGGTGACKRRRGRGTEERGQKVLHAVCNICSFSFHPVTRTRNAAGGGKKTSLLR